MNLLKAWLACSLAASVQFSSAQVKPASHEWKEAASGGYTYRYVTNDPQQARFYTLKNGLTVILSVNKKEPRIQTLIGVRAGSNNDPKDHTGLAHYLEHLLFKGTDQYGSLDWAKEKLYIDQVDNLYDKYNVTTDLLARKAVYHEIDSVSGIAAKYAIANEYDKMMSNMGAQGTNAHTSVEETVYEEDIPSNAIDKYLAVQAERFRNPVFRLFHTELEAVYEEKNRGLDNDQNKLHEALMGGLFPTHNYGQQTTIGTVEHLKNPNIKAIRQFYNTYYVPNNMAIVMAGDFNPDYVIKTIDQDFSYQQSKPFPEYTAPAEAPITAPIVKEVVGPDAESVTIGFRLGGIREHKDNVLATVMSQILANGKAGLIDLNLNRQQKVLSANAGSGTFKDYGVMVLSGKAKNGQSLEEVKDLLLGQLDLLKNGQFDETLLKAIVNNFKLSEIQGLQSNGNRAYDLMDDFIKSKGDLYADDVAFVDDMSKVTKQAVVDYANKYFGNNYVLVYKRKGEDKNIVKVEKPTITPVSVNRDDHSPFLDKIAAIPATPVQPLWLNFDKDIQKSKVGPAQVLYVQNKDNGLFRLYYRFNMGTWSDRKLSLAASYLQYLGTDKYSSEEISKQFYNIACSFNITAGTENVTIGITGLQENFDKAVSLFDELMTNCKVNEQALAALKGRIAKSRADAKLNKKAITSALLQYGIYGAKNPFNYQLSTADINNTTAHELVDILHKLPTYQHMVIYYGPRKLDAVTADVARLHKMPATFTPVLPAVKFDKTSQTQQQVLFANYDMVQAEVNWIRNTTTYNPDETAKLLLFNNYFGAGMESIVFQTIRESKALAYSTYAQYASPDKKDDRYTEVAYVGSQADKMDDAIHGMNELLDSMPLVTKNLEMSKNAIRQDIETERITEDGIIFSYLSAEKLGLHTDLRKKVYGQIASITMQDLQQLHDTQLAHQPYTYCILASDKKVSMDALKKYGAVKVLTLEELFGY
ncbi:Predicted Zn-dependent peptidase [Chitinophaga costaii]|uniref:Predicted Zn-dependent peptidase n=1 Tax=Chitinophaga costaii TaxID=1335309 RepID=A0A1C4FSE1_9BACT|nr:M16 family metallopeptidase [Chitinophaga costaii]PUZ20510.1 insulinase family protein [Chitinophaga costaii]SCC58792.1 Predicted Zn-dependent peptidase [Chitinophaga costaii]